jgi:hypothetical protein
MIQMAIEKFGEGKVENIKTFENQYNLQLPKDYINFLLQYNGGIVEKDENCQVIVKSLKGTIHIDVLYGIDTTHENANINTWMDMFKGDILDGAIIIGDSIEHGFLVMMCSKDNSGICYWDHTFAFPNSSDESNTYYIANTFDDFIKGLL